MIQPEPKLALIDADFLVYRIGFSTENEEQKIAEARLTEYLTDIVYFHLKADDYKAYITGKSNFRFDVAVTHEYKGNRKDFVKPRHYDALRNHLVRLGAEITEGQEADDAVAIECLQNNYWIVHQDKDLDQLPGWHYNPIKGLKYFVTEYEGLRNFYQQILTGDRVDNIVGLKGIGPVKAAKLLRNCTNEKELYAAVCNAYGKAEESIDRLIENARLLWLRREEGQVWEPPIETEQRKEQGKDTPAVGDKETA